MKRRVFIQKSGLTLGGLAIAPTAFAIPKLPQAKMGFVLPKLAYAYDALEPFIDKQTMEIHHAKHHQGYVNKLNKALEAAAIQNKSLVEILKKVSTYSSAVRNNAGGHYNHSLFWTILSPSKNTVPSALLQDHINKQFGSLSDLKGLINKAATQHFGSGWVWLAVDDAAQLFVSTTPNQDNPLMDLSEQQGIPILGIDLWEHAYYLKYQNKRGDYLSAIWNLMDWEEISSRFEPIILEK